MSPLPAPPDAGDPASQPILLPLDSAADPARASAACTAFLCVVRFLRRNRSLYRQLVIGFLEREGLTPFQRRSFYHAQPPHRSTTAARALAESADFTCSFLPDPGSWLLHDATDGLLLLSLDSSENMPGFDDLVVCDPLRRLHVRIPRIPVDLTTGTFTPEFDLIAGTFPSDIYFPSFFAPTGEEGSSFRVISMIYGSEKMKVSPFVFSSATDQWRRVTFDGWEFIGGIEVMLTSCRHHPHISLRRASGLFSEILMLDTHKMEFSVVRTPLFRHDQQNAIFEAGEGRLGFLTIGDGMLDLYCKAWQQDNGFSVEEWQHETTIPIPLQDLIGIPSASVVQVMATYSCELSHETSLSAKTFQGYTISR